MRSIFVSSLRSARSRLAGARLDGCALVYDAGSPAALAAAGTVIESFGSTSLVQVGNNFYFYPVGGSSGPQFKYRRHAGHGGTISESSYHRGRENGERLSSRTSYAGYGPVHGLEHRQQRQLRFQRDRRRHRLGFESVLKSLEPSFQSGPEWRRDDRQRCGTENRDRIVSVQPVWCRWGTTFTFTPSAAAAARSSNTGYAGHGGAV